jgi:hypothetical protein
MKVTLCWSDAEVTRTWQSVSWKNGESKVICAYTYNSDVSGERWNARHEGLHLIQSSSPSDYSPSKINWRKFARVRFIGVFSTYYGGYNMTFLASRNATAANPPPTQFTTSSFVANNITSRYPLPADWPTNTVKTHISDDQFGFVTSSNGVTIKWQPISGAGESWNNWKNEATLDLHATNCHSDMQAYPCNQCGTVSSTSCCP